MEAYKHLLSYNIKPSVQRIAVMEYLLNHRTHPNVDEIYSALNESMPTLSRTTVYNTLRLFSENGAAQVLTIDEKNICYDADVTPHAHFLCKNCGKIYDLSSQHNIGGEISKEIEGHSVSEVHYYYKGICKNCLTK